MTKAKMKKCSFCEKVLPEDKLKKEVMRSCRVYYFCDECAKKMEKDKDKIVKELDEVIKDLTELSRKLKNEEETGE